MSSAQARLRISGLNMVIAIAVLIIPLVILVALCQPRADDVRTVDATNTYAEALRAASFPVQQPRGLSAGWRTTASAVRPSGNAVTVRVTYMTPSGGAFQFVQSNEAADTLLADILGNSQLQNTEEIAGKTWQKYALERGDIAYVLLEKDHTIYVAGDASKKELHTFITSLR